MARQFSTRQALRSRLIILSAAPSFICLLVTALAITWIVGDLHRDLGERALRSAGTGMEQRAAELRARMQGLAGLLARDNALREAMATDAGPDRDMLRLAVRDLRRAEPSVRAIRLELAETGRRWDFVEGCDPASGEPCGQPELPAAHGTAMLDLPELGPAAIHVSAFLDKPAAERMAAIHGGAVMLLRDREVRISTIALPGPPMEEWAPAWLQGSLREERPASGRLEIGGRAWLARSMPVPLEAGVRPGMLLLLLPGEIGTAPFDETLGIILPVVVMILVLAMICAAAAARRLGSMLAALTEALRRLGRGDLSVSIPPPPRDAPREVVELTDACILFRDASAERSRLSERLRWLANFDALTGLPNRALLGDRLELAVAAAQRDGNALAVLAMDLDHFKEVNDVLGHAAGDEVLRVVAGRLRNCLRATDTLARIGGDEFILVAPGLEAPEQLATFAARLLAVVEEPVTLGAEQRVIGISVGAAILRSGQLGSRPEALVQDADLALYQAKADGGSCLRVFEPEMDERLRTRRALVADLRNAMARQELTILFQPQVSTATRRIKGAEALLRWYHPQRGMISPETFIPLAEETGLIVPIGAWVLEEACHVASGWGGLHLAVNVSANQVRQASFVETVELALARSGLPPECLELEITEAAMLAHTADALDILSRLRSLGVRLAMDDFGTGYSSLATLQRFRFDKIKVDRSFIRHLAQDAKAVALLRAVIALGSALDVITNAEGVEDEGQLSLLRAEGCEEAQGYLFGRPMSAADFRAQVLRQNARAA
ncbi:putative bifunctional diguanylate cyclase/phosphodiesterase [Roseomonas xinghualingensis]|uniref:putative bifunctional diguanylate cyclase/phosphodiesterase n=1 Tax=Roseomonas xinghualingensis TaxID=2986475 RepID=UPI0021F2494E|nr:EAL domain-containing protein [Roseomonas sp. SXEYE001]MCV4206708.1 EAL domain-containing protein [Roseomonas sp. SXEYE001]